MNLDSKLWGFCCYGCLAFLKEKKQQQQQHGVFQVFFRRVEGGTEGKKN